MARREVGFVLDRLEVRIGISWKLIKLSEVGEKTPFYPQKMSFFQDVVNTIVG